MNVATTLAPRLILGAVLLSVLGACQYIPFIGKRDRGEDEDLNTTEQILFGVRGRLRTLPPARSQVNIIETRKREHSRKPDEQHGIIEACSPGPYLELFARYPRPGWTAWGDEAAAEITPRGRVHAGYRVPEGDQRPTARQEPLLVAD